MPSSDSESHELVRRLLLADACNDIRADVAGLGFRSDPAQPCRDGIGGAVHVLAVERVAHLEAKRVARAESRRRDLGERQQRPPEPRSIGGPGEELEPVLAGVARPRRKCGTVSSMTSLIWNRAGGSQPSFASSRGDLESLRALKRDQAGPVRLVDELEVFGRV